MLQVVVVAAAAVIVPEAAAAAAVVVVYERTLVHGSWRPTLTEERKGKRHHPKA